MKGMKLEHHRQKVVSLAQFFIRLGRYGLFSLMLIAVSLGIGMLGYHYFGQLNLLDSFQMSSMILTGMGPVNAMQTNLGKLFATFYALFSGVVFLTFAAVLFAPALHRFLHKFHLEFEETDTKD